MDNEMVIPQDLISEIRDIMLAARSNVAHQVNEQAYFQAVQPEYRIRLLSCRIH